ncbi:MAG TPA: DNA mismatch repair protein MutS [Lachnospiraceae bacterium]|nr:DNA mismatch repair protein MutS [Lachnospiraceae bacterium]
MDKAFTLLEFDQIKNTLKSYTHTKQAADMVDQLIPSLVETELRTSLRYTTQARELLELAKEPPIPSMEHIHEYVSLASAGELLFPEQLEQAGIFLASVERLKAYLQRGIKAGIGIAYYEENLVYPKELHDEIERAIRYGKVDDYASAALRSIRTKLLLLEEKVKNKAESVLRSHKEYMSDSACVQRNGRICVPVKSAYRNKVKGSLLDKSATGATVFIEPESVGELYDEMELLRIEEDNEVRRILYTLTVQLSDQETEIKEDIRVIVLLDFLFAKGKLSLDENAVEPAINTDGYICLKEARHPLLKKEECVPLDFTLGKERKGIIITGPNTGGKTVTIKTVGLFAIMAACGLHLPCKEADMGMFCQVLCDIGDGQNLADNLSTFSAHLTQLLSILQRVNGESLVLLDELGSGTDPAEGMGIAVAVLEQLRKSGCLFLVTTHYPEVKEYAGKHSQIVNARMAFDRESLRPLYRLEIGQAGESCALYIAKKLGLPNFMLRDAAQAAYGENYGQVFSELGLYDQEEDEKLEKCFVPRIRKAAPVKRDAVHGVGFTRGDSVEVLPEKVIGIVVKPADKDGNVLVQVKKEKQLINHKRLKLKVAAEVLYPEDYDFSIIFDTVENRKAHHKMGKGHQEGLQALYSSFIDS